VLAFLFIQCSSTLTDPQAPPEQYPEPEVSLEKWGINSIPQNLRQFSESHEILSIPLSHCNFLNGGSYKAEGSCAPHLLKKYSQILNTWK
jgi:hypothetical protein